MNAMPVDPATHRSPSRAAAAAEEKVDDDRALGRANDAKGRMLADLKYLRDSVEASRRAQEAISKMPWRRVLAVSCHHGPQSGQRPAKTTHINRDHQND